MSRFFLRCSPTSLLAIRSRTHSDKISSRCYRCGSSTTESVTTGVSFSSRRCGELWNVSTRSVNVPQTMNCSPAAHHARRRGPQRGSADAQHDEHRSDDAALPHPSSLPRFNHRCSAKVPADVSRFDSSMYPF